MFRHEDKARVEQSGLANRLYARPGAVALGRRGLARAYPTALE
jgi:hypothetical protein